MLYGEQNNEIEREKLQAELKLREGDMRLNHLKIETELKAAEAEERVLTELLQHRHCQRGQPNQLRSLVS